VVQVNIFKSQKLLIYRWTIQLITHSIHSRHFWL